MKAEDILYFEHAKRVTQIVTVWGRYEIKDKIDDVLRGLTDEIYHSIISDEYRAFHLHGTVDDTQTQPPAYVGVFSGEGSHAVVLSCAGDGAGLGFLEEILFNVKGYVLAIDYMLSIVLYLYSFKGSLIKIILGSVVAEIFSACGGNAGLILSNVHIVVYNPGQTPFS